jgi:hypothetical protein
MRGGAEALECHDLGGSRRAQGNLPPNQTGSPSFFLFLFSFFFFFFISFYLYFRQGGGDQRGGMRRPGGLVATKPGIRAKGTVAKQWNSGGETRVRRTKRKTWD